MVLDQHCNGEWWTYYTGKDITDEFSIIRTYLFFYFDYCVNLMEYITHRYKLLLITYLQCNLYFTIIVLSIHDTRDIFT